MKKLTQLLLASLLISFSFAFAHPPKADANGKVEMRAGSKTMYIGDKLKRYNELHTGAEFNLGKYVVLGAETDTRGADLGSNYDTSSTLYTKFKYKIEDFKFEAKFKKAIKAHNKLLDDLSNEFSVSYNAKLGKLSITPKLKAKGSSHAKKETIAEDLDAILELSYSINFTEQVTAAVDLDTTLNLKKGKSNHYLKNVKDHFTTATTFKADYKISDEFTLGAKAEMGYKGAFLIGDYTGTTIGAMLTYNF